MAGKFERYKDASGDASALNGIESARTNAPDAVLDDQTD